MLELDEGQLSRPVLRGRGGSNTSLLPGRSVAGSSQRGSVCARPDPAGPGGRRPRGRGAWSVEREAWGERIVAGFTHHNRIFWKSGRTLRLRLVQYSRAGVKDGQFDFLG